jgi:serine/threonine protein kinase
VEDASALDALEPEDLSAHLGLPPNLRMIQPVHSSTTGVIWSGRDRRLGMDVVVKVLAPEHRDRLEAESRAMARLGEHPNVLSALMVGHAGDGTAWVVTERMAATLREASEEATVPQILVWAGEVAAAIEAVHGGGVIHGDVTPANVLIDSSGTARLGDFGAARLEGDSHGTERTGHTPRYAAPERRRGMAASRESDVYGYGATMLAVLPDGRSGVPRRTRRLLRRCVRTDPERRPDAPAVARAMSRR